MPNPIETLKRIEYTTIEQFLEDVNRNFAVIENSPLYKGIPGNEGDNGLPGLKGVRGTKFLFVKLTEFQSKFSGELSSSTQINLDYLNNKLLTFENKNKLLEALNITELVDRDIVVLSNTIMLSYDYIENKFVNTGIAFNEQSNLLNNIQAQIEAYVEYYVTHNQTINNLSNIFEGYSTYAKNYADNNNVFITSNLTQTSVYSPYIPGYNSNIGILLDNHKYFGFSDSQFPKNNNGTIVFGAMKKYYDLLMSTIASDQTETLTSDYAPGVNNIPAAVFLQDTENSGLLFGYKGRQNLKRFGSIFKNALHEIVIKSDSGINQSEYSELKIHKDYLKYDKLVQLGNDLEVSRDSKFFGDINNEFIKTGKFTEGANSTNNFNTEIVEIGKESTEAETVVRNISDIETYKNYISTVFVTNSDGVLLKDYSIETGLLSNTLIPNLNLISETINSDKKILTSYYFGYLARKINAISTFCTNNYWRKNQFNNQEIPDLWLSNSLKVDKNVNLTGGFITTDLLNNETNINSSKVTFAGNLIKYTSYINNVLVTDSNGLISHDYSLENSVLNASELVNGTPLLIFNESNNKILSTKYYAHLAKKINNIDNNITTNYWKKTDFGNFSIPNLYLSDDLIVKGNVIFNPNNIVVFQVNKTTNEVIIGNINKQTTLTSTLIKLSQFTNNVLVTDSNGNIVSTYHLENNNFNNSELDENTPITLNVANGDSNSIAKGTHVNWLANKINNIITWVTGKYWSKIQFGTGIIPSLWLSNNLRVDQNFVAGNNSNPNIATSGSSTNIGKIGGVTKIDGADIILGSRQSIVPVTDDNGKILSTHSLETLAPGSGVLTDNQITIEYWDKDSQPQEFDNQPSLATKILTSNYYSYIVSHLKAIRTLLFDRPTYSEVSSMLGNSLPTGAIIMWTNTLGEHDPNIFTVCDGRVIPNSGGLTTPNMINKFIKASLTPNNVGGNPNHRQTLKLSDIPPHQHRIPEHQHSYKDTYLSESARWGSDKLYLDDLPYSKFGSNGGVDNDNVAYYKDRMTALDGGSYTNNQQINNATDFSIEPRSYSAIYLMKNPPVGWVPPVIIPPTAPSNVTASLITQTSMRINWTPATDNVGVSVYKIYLNGVGISTGTYHDFTNLTPNTTYSIYVVALDAAGNTSPQSNIITPKTLDNSSYTLYVEVPNGGLDRTLTFLNSSSVTVGVLGKGSNSRNIVISALVGEQLYVKAYYNNAGGGQSGTYPVRLLDGTILGSLSWADPFGSNNLSLGVVGSLPGAHLRVNI